MGALCGRRGEAFEDLGLAGGHLPPQDVDRVVFGLGDPPSWLARWRLQGLTGRGLVSMAVGVRG
jgi:hypothetical protein